MAVVLVAGCAANDPDDRGSPSDAAFEGIVAVATEDTGVIRGFVVDEAVSPIDGAKVLVEGTGRTTESNDAGAFAVDGLHPGVYLLEVSKPGFADATVGVTVVAGDSEPDFVKVGLVRVPGTEPYVVAMNQEGYLWCAYMVQSVQRCDLLGTTAEDRHEWFLALDQVPEYLQTELVWASTQSLGDNLQMFTFAADDAETPSDLGLCRVWGVSPLVCRISATEGSGEWSVALEESGLGSGRGLRLDIHAYCTVCSPASVGVVLEQRFTTYTHVFFNFEPPADWQFSLHGSPVVPDGLLPVGAR